MPINPKILIDDLPGVFDVAHATYLEEVFSDDPITPESQNTEAGLLRTMQQRLSLSFYSAREFGVQGDGVIDDTANLTTCFANGVAIYYMAPGTYLLSGNVPVTTGSIVFAAGVTLVGGALTGTYTQLGLTGEDTDLPNGLNVGGTLNATTAVAGTLSYTGVFTGGDGLTLANSATPSVAGRNLFVTGGTTQITNFADSVVGQVIHIVAQHTLTITHSALLNLAGKTNYLMEPGNTLTLVRFLATWWELGRVGEQGDEGLVLPNSATPSVSGSNLFAIRDNTTRTDFTQFFIGKVVRLVMDTTGTTTITNNASIKLAGNGNFDMVRGDSLTLMRFLASWIEVGRTLRNGAGTGVERTLAASATPNVSVGGAGISSWKTSGATNITSFIGGFAGQIIIVRSDDATSALSLVHATNTLDLAGNRTFVMEFDDVCILQHKDGNFHEIGRSSRHTGGATEVITLNNTGTPTLGSFSNPIQVATTSGTSNITNILGGRDGQVLRVFHAHTLTYEHNANITLFTGANTAVAAGRTIDFLRVSSAWKEVKYI